ncbi:MAG: hypothetical protein IJU44_09965 [Kiritimatiellae bacterium]|nr:hypothetical protein [Kiritimatiellia bacterium]
MKAKTAELTETAVFCLAAAAVSVCLAAAYSPIVWKFAQQTLFFADLAGLRELMSRNGAPGGLLDWLARGISVTGLGPLFWLPYPIAAIITVWMWRQSFPRLNRGLWPALVFPSALIALYPALLSGTGVWLANDYAAAWRNTLGLWCAFGAWLITAKSKPWVSIPVTALLVPPLGIYPLLGAIAANLWMFPLLAVPWLYSALFYYDLAPQYAYLKCGSILNFFRLTPLNVWNVLGFASFIAAAVLSRRLPAPRERRMPQFARWAALMLMAVLTGTALAMCIRKPDMRSQFRRERAIVEGRYADALKVPLSNGRALRMESAYRILALHKTGQLPDRLFEEPIWSTQKSTDAEENLMDGHELLFAYGLLLPARRYLYETMSTKGWMPRHFLILGDIATLYGELNLAERNYLQLSRCPYYRSLAKKRLDMIHADPVNLPDDLQSIAKAAKTLFTMLDTMKNADFFDLNQNPEQLIYNHFSCIKNGDTAEAKLCIACAMLNKDENLLHNNQGMLQSLFGVKGIPDCVYEAMLTAPDKPVPAMVPDRIKKKFTEFKNSARQTDDNSRDAFINRWANSYFFYYEYVK